MANIFQGKNILVTGGTGSIGREIIRKVLQYDPKVVRALSNDENGLFALEQELCRYPNMRFLVGDVRDEKRLQMAVEDINFIFHAAALKHVPLCENNPFEAVRTNVLGTQNLIEAAMAEEVTKLITISTDKAVNPISVMGATKLLAERLTISANYYKGLRETVFSCVRFGNVLDSRGSVVPLFTEQIKQGGPVTVTDPDMTRFVMSIPQAVDLVIAATAAAKGGEIFILKMPALRIGDLAEVMIEAMAPWYGHKPKNIKIEVKGKRMGEKDYEELMTADEAVHAYENKAMFVVASPWLETNFKRRAVVAEYSSGSARRLSKAEIKSILEETLRLA